jgi:hypothetical protein
MASFLNTLAWDDPYLYAFYVCELYRCGAAHLGYGKDAPLAKPSKLTRSSNSPVGMSHAAWVALASLRDHLNAVLDYSYDMGIPGLKDIALLGVLGSPKLVEAVGGITWPDDLVTILKAVGYTKVVEKANTTIHAGAGAAADASAYFTSGYRVLILINTNMLHDDGGSVDGSFTASHWVRLRSKIESKQKHFKSGGENGVRFSICDPARGQVVAVPASGAYLRRSGFLLNFYGYVAAKK